MKLENLEKYLEMEEIKNKARIYMISLMNSKTNHILFLLLSLLTLTSNSFAQTTKAPKGWQLFGEGKGNEVRLLWTNTEWADSIQGMIVKRRTPGGTWTTLTSSPIYPRISPTKNISNVSNDASVVADLKKQIADKPADYAPMDSLAFLQTISAPSGLGMFTFALVKDFNKALIIGFAFYDKKANAAGSPRVEYGLFYKNTHGKEAGPLATVTCKIGGNPTYNLPYTTSIRGNKKRNQIRVEWKVNTAAYLEAKVLQGFYIDRVDNGVRTRLTKNSIWPNTNVETFPIFVNDEVPDANKKYTYELIPVSVLGYEASPFMAVYDPANVPGDFLIKLQSNYVAGDTNISFTIQVPAEVEKFIESYELEEKETIINYKKVEGPSSKKQYRLAYDKARSADQSYEFRIKANLNDGYDPIYSGDVSVFYNPKIVPKKTTGLKAEFVKQNGQNFAQLRWNELPGAAEYQIYLKQLNGEEMIWEASLPKITTNEFLYPLPYAGSRAYTFAVAAVDESGDNIGDLSEKTTVTSPSSSLLRVWPKEFKQVEDQKVLITWDYSEPADLVGYRLYENNKLVADEKVLKKGIMQWKSAKKENGNYVYTIEAITNSGIVSEKSFPKTVIVK